MFIIYKNGLVYTKYTKFNHAITEVKRIWTFTTFIQIWFSNHRVYILHILKDGKITLWSSFVKNEHRGRWIPVGKINIHGEN